MSALPIDGQAMTGDAPFSKRTRADIAAVPISNISTKPVDRGNRIVVVNGFKVFHLATLAEEYDRAGRLQRLITGAYPFSERSKFLSRIAAFAGRGRFPARRVNVSEPLIDANWLGEALCFAGVALDRRGWIPPYEVLNGLAVDSMSRRAEKILREGRAGAKIFHVRSGFGGRAIGTAASLGYLTVCDHSIAHPRLVEGLVENNGNLDLARSARPPKADMWRRVERDLAASDHVLVNSDFVKDTFSRAGSPTNNVHVLYLGIDDQFQRFVEAARAAGIAPPRNGPLRLLFAGGVMQRKGVGTLAQALSGMSDVDWRLSVAGNFDPRLGSQIDAFAADPRVEFLGMLLRGELARRMCASEIFVFPSLAEGSAKVVFEAMAAGCFVITTPNSGSIVRDGVHGFLVPPGDAGALANAVRRAAANREMVAKIGMQNAKAVASEYSQVQYGRKVLALFDGLLEQAKSAEERTSNCQPCAG